MPNLVGHPTKIVCRRKLVYVEPAKFFMQVAIVGEHAAKEWVVHYNAKRKSADDDVVSLQTVMLMVNRNATGYLAELEESKHSFRELNKFVPISVDMENNVAYLKNNVPNDTGKHTTIHLALSVADEHTSKSFAALKLMGWNIC